MCTPHNFMTTVTTACAIVVVAPGNNPCHIMQWLNAVAKVLRGCPGISGTWCSIPETKDVTQREVMHVFEQATCFKDWRLARYLSRSSKNWGPWVWMMLHVCSCFYTPEERSQSMEMLELLPYVLPCRPCRVHVRENLVTSAAARASAWTRREFVNYVIMLHNTVSAQVTVDSDRTSRVLAYLPGNADARMSCRQAICHVQTFARSSIQDPGPPEDHEDGEQGCTGAGKDLAAAPTHWSSRIH